MILTAYQIYFDGHSKKNLLPGFTPYDNSGKLTEFFENEPISVIADRRHDSDYLGVFSHDINVGFPFYEEIYGERLKFGFEGLEKAIAFHYHHENPDVFGFCKRRSNPNIVRQAENYHPGIYSMIEKIVQDTGFCDKIPDTVPPILFNYWIAKTAIYSEYVTQLLRPAMAIMKDMAVLWQDSRYQSISKRHNKPEDRRKFSDAWGTPWIPYHPFVCERLPSIFFAVKRYKIKHIF
ncbi:hypothetical protein [Moorena sp. SIO3H5]|uniref:hypothetical protein n=1 Tax=Moorena sp. SIO3H5 TaxID=2607834 RepID=UPI0013BBCDD0|nr:hypothetical protein [Moorena sp. SIO3H5]NEO72138.1 hypothetical protein [Moorena sp. SIO3H5]